MKLGIVVPSLNQTRFVKEAIDGLRSLTCPVHVVVQDAGSRDGTWDVLRALAGSDERFTLVREPDDGQSDALNKGFIRLGDCDVLTWLNTDDVVQPRALEQIAWHVSDTPRIVGAFGMVGTIDERGLRIAEPVLRRSPVTRRRLLLRGPCMPQPGTVFRARVFDEVGGVGRSWELAMDYDLWLRLARFGPFEGIPRHVADFRIHGASKSERWARQSRREVLAIRLHALRSSGHG